MPNFNHSYKIWIPSIEPYRPTMLWSLMRLFPILSSYFCACCWCMQSCVYFPCPYRPIVESMTSSWVIESAELQALVTTRFTHTQLYFTTDVVAKTYILNAHCFASCFGFLHLILAPRRVGYMYIFSPCCEKFGLNRLRHLFKHFIILLLRQKAAHKH